MVFINEGFFEVAIESWPWVGFVPHLLLNSVQTLKFSSDDRAIRLVLRANFIQLLQFYRLFSVRFHFVYCLRQLRRLF